MIRQAVIVVGSIVFAITTVARADNYMIKSPNPEPLRWSEIISPKDFNDSSLEERCKWYKEKLSRFSKFIRLAAEQENIPLNLLASTILAEMADIDYADCIQDMQLSGTKKKYFLYKDYKNFPTSVFYMKSIKNQSFGIAQITPATAIKYNAVQVPVRSLLTQEDELEFNIAYRLLDRRIAIFAAAKIIKGILKDIERHQESDWVKQFISPGYRFTAKDPYGALRPPKGKSRSARVQHEREKALAKLVAAVYNSHSILIPGKDRKVPGALDYFSTKGDFSDALIQGQNAEFIAESLYECPPSLGFKKPDVKEAELKEPQSLTCPCKVPKDAKHYEKPNLEYWKMPNGKYVGPYRTWYDKEKTKPHEFRCYNKDGKPDGTWTRWNEKPWVRTHVDEYEDGKRKSLERYDNEERPTTKETYENGKLYEWIEYNVYGNESKERKRAKGTFKERTHQIETGTITKYFIKSKKEETSETYKDGRKDGEWITWYEEPYRKKSIIHYKDNKIHGSYQTWSKDGIPLSDDFYENGKLKKRTIYSKGEATEVLEYSNGKLVSSTKLGAGK